MSSKLIPSSPADVMVIRNITPDVVTLSVPFSRFGILKVGGRATIIRLTSGTLAVFSPVALTPDVKAKVAEMGGKVGYLIAPDIEHHIFISEWAKEYPDAKLIGPEGLPEKRAGQKDERIRNDDHFAFVFSPKNKDPQGISEEFAADFEAEYVGAHANREIVLFYKPDKMLIEADLLFNMPPTEQYSRASEEERNSHGLINRLWNALFKTSGEAKAHKRVQWYLFSNANKDRSGYNSSVQKIESWDFKTIIPCHGDVIEGNAKEVFRKIFEWHLQSHK
ncbi:hypothetical protein DL765_001503 [Monosporascus sp. GIB2]|nr:hypothetical protein DL765_001503 [Monosporascus sp. GIB2]